MQVLTESLKSVTDMMNTAVLPLLSSINDSIEAILLTMHREDFSAADPGDTAAPAQACSLYMKELQAFLERISKDFLSTFTCREFVSLHLFSMAEKTIERWMI